MYIPAKFLQISPRGFFTLLMAFMLAACSSAYDWRVVRADDLAYEALYPSKPTRAQRTLVINGVRYTMTMEAAKANESVFAVGTIQLPKDDRGGDNILRWLKENTSKSLGPDSHVQELNENSFRVAGSQTLVMPATGIRLSGIGPDQSIKELQVQWLRRVDESGIERIYQLTTLHSFEKQVTQDQQKLIKEHNETFYAGFRPY